MIRSVSRESFEDEAMVTVLLLGTDDDRRALLAVTDALGARLLHVTTPLEALRASRDLDLAAILLDASTSAGGGFHTAACLSAVHRDKLPPLLLIGDEDEDARKIAKGYDLGAAGWIQRPLDARELRAKLRSFVILFRRMMRGESAPNSVLARAARQKEEFLTVVSHELCTPISALKLQVQSAQRSLRRAPEEIDRVLSKMEIANRQVDRLTRLVDALLESARVGEGRLTLEYEQTDLVESTRSVVARFEGELTQTKTRVDIEASESVFGAWDSARLEQAIFNLLHNAIKFGAGRTIGIRVTATSGVAEFSVEDQGIGIARHDQDRIFERFERAVSADAYGGLGVGLYITSQIARMHGGDVFVQSEPGKGARFTMLLPLSAADEVTKQTIRESGEVLRMPIAASGGM